MGTLEQQAIKFPRGTHDDIIDTVQMIYNMYELMPNTKSIYSIPTIQYDSNGSPVFS